MTAPGATPHQRGRKGVPPDDGTADCCVRFTWASDLEIFEYLTAPWREAMTAIVPKAWQEFVRGTGPRPVGRVPSPFSIDFEYHNPDGDEISSDRPTATTEILDRIASHLDAVGVGRAVLCLSSGSLVPALPNVHLTIEGCRAINDWLIERCVAHDPRFYTGILVPTQVPEAAATEIRRIGGHERVAGILLTANGLARPFGHPVYHPIYAAAAELGRPVIIQSGGDAVTDVVTYPTAAGIPGTYTAYRTLSPQTLMTHATSLIGQGVPSTFSGLRFLLLGGGFVWLPPFLWNLDTNYLPHRISVPWLRDLPSEYFRQFFCVGTHPFNYSVSPERLRRYCGSLPGYESLICYSGGFSDWDHDTPQKLRAALPPEWWKAVMADNAHTLFGWDADDSVMLA